MNNIELEKEIIYKSLLEISSEAFRLKKAYEHIINLLDIKEQKKSLNKIKWFENKLSDALEKCELRIVNFEGEVYSTGIPATPINIEDFDASDELYVKQTIEPTIIDKNAVIVQSGSIILEKVLK